MNFWNNLAPGQIQAFMRPIYAAITAGTGVMLFLGLTQADVSGIGAHVKEIGDGLVSVSTGIAGLVTILGPIAMSIGSAIQKGRAPSVASVAAMAGTVVSPNGKTITVVDPKLAQVAAAAATVVSGK
jgi:hypothetical protein